MRKLKNKIFFTVAFVCVVQFCIAQVNAEIQLKVNGNSIKGDNYEIFYCNGHNYESLPRNNNSYLISSELMERIKNGSLKRIIIEYEKKFVEVDISPKTIDANSITINLKGYKKCMLSSKRKIHISISFSQFVEDILGEIKKAKPVCTSNIN